MENYTILNKMKKSFFEDKENLENYLLDKKYSFISDFAKEYAIQINNEQYYNTIINNIDIIFDYYQSKNGIKPFDQNDIELSFANIFFDLFKRKSFDLFKISKKTAENLLLLKDQPNYKLDVIKLNKLISHKNIDEILLFANKYSIKVNDEFISIKANNRNMITKIYPEFLDKTLTEIFSEMFLSNKYNLYEINNQINIIPTISTKQDKKPASFKIKQTLRILFDKNILTIYIDGLPKPYNIDTDLKRLSMIINDKYIDLIINLMSIYFDKVILKILLPINDDKYDLFYKISNQIILYLKNSINKNSIDPNDLALFIKNVEILITHLIEMYPSKIGTNKNLSFELSKLKSQKIIDIKEVKTLIRGSNNIKKSLDIFNNGLNFEVDIFKSDLPFLSSITESSLTSYIRDIGETPYKVEDINKIENENSLLKTITFFQILKYYLKMSLFSFPEKVKDNSSLNHLFYNLLVDNNIIPFLINYLKDDTITYFITQFSKKIENENDFENTFSKILEGNIPPLLAKDFIKRFGKWDNIPLHLLKPFFKSLSTKIFELANNLFKILGDNTLEFFLLNLFEWYRNYHELYQNQNENLIHIKTGFIAENTLTTTRNNSLYIESKNKIAELEGKVSYAKKVYSILELSDLVPDNVNIKNIIKNGIKEIEREKEFEFDYWQKDALQFAKNGTSFILSGPTSGGKTSLAIALIEEFFKDQSVKMLFIVPTDPLAFQVYTNLMKTFQESTIKPVIGIYTESLNIIKQNINILIGTPKDINNILTLKDFTLFTNFSDLPNIFTNRKLSFDKIIIDEIHTMGNNYDKSIEGLKRAKSIQELLKCSKSTSQIIGFSATLTDKSIQTIKNFIHSNVGIDVEDIKYTFNDIGKPTKDHVLTKLAVLPQTKYIINEEEGINGLFNIKKGTKIVKNIITGRFIFRLMKSISFWGKTSEKSPGKTPCAIFSGDEIETFDFYSRLINFLEEGSNSCIKWKDLSDKFKNEDSLEERQEEIFGLTEKKQKHIKVKKTNENYEKFNNTWITLILEELKGSLNKPETEDNIPFNECDLIDDFNTFLFNKKINDISSGSLKSISPEMYGLMFELIHFEEYTTGKIFRKPFSGKHPYYRFIVNELRSDMFSPDVDKKLTRFGELLKIQKIDYTTKNPLVTLILTGISYGIGLITSTVPFSIQCEIVSYLRKSSLSENILPFIFCDDGMSMGINYSFVSTIILKDNLESILTSKYLQIKGRAGRRNYDTTNPPEVYMVNISNANSLDFIEDISLDDIDTEQFFYISEKLITSVQNYILQSLNGTLPMTLNSYFELNIEELISSKELTGRRQLRLMKLQVKELFDRLRNVCPSICSTYLSEFYSYLQRVEYEKIQQDL